MMILYQTSPKIACRVSKCQLVEWRKVDTTAPSAGLVVLP